MAARLRFAVATATDPHILILDEALSTGDAQFRERGQARMAQIREQAGCVLFVSHTMTEARGRCSRVVWLDRGTGWRPGTLTTSHESPRRPRSSSRPGTTWPQSGRRSV